MIYCTPEDQEKGFPELIDSIGWNCIRRRNMGLLKAYKLGVDVVATVDDDDIPYDSWGGIFILGRKLSVIFLKLI